VSFRVKGGWSRSQ